MKFNRSGLQKSIEQATKRYQAWRELLDLSTELAIAGLKAQGLSTNQAWKILGKRWEKSSREHQRINRKIADLLHDRDKVLKRRSS